MNVRHVNIKYKITFSWYKYVFLVKLSRINVYFHDQTALLFKHLLYGASKIPWFYQDAKWVWPDRNTKKHALPCIPVSKRPLHRLKTKLFVCIEDDQLTGWDWYYHCALLMVKIRIQGGKWFIKFLTIQNIFIHCPVPPPLPSLVYLRWALLIPDYYY